MSRDAARLLRAVRLRCAARAALLLAPALFGLGWALHPLISTPALLWALALTLGGGASIAALRVSPRWLARRLNAHLPAFEDSAALLWQAPRGEVESLQRVRLEARLAAVRAGDLLPPISRRALAASFVAGGLLSISPFVRDDLVGAPAGAPDPTATVAADSTPRLEQAWLSVAPPAYTGLAEQRLPRLDATLAEGSTVHWSLQFSPAPATVSLRFVDGSELALDAKGERWEATRTLDASTRYRVWVDGSPHDPEAAALRLDVTPDQPPVITVASPEQTLTLVDSAAPVMLRFDASDDHGLGAARLTLTLAQGQGEQVKVSEREIALQGAGSATRRSFTRRLDLAALGFSRGDDAILRIEVADNRAPRPQRTRSPSYILRWPPAAASEGEGVEGVLQRTLPAYFRSQRQIIIDSEALLERRAALPADQFVDRSDAIGVDQRLLRLRYGEFLGEEAEGGEAGDDHADHDDHGDHAAGPAAPTPDDRQAVLERYGHTHDYSEAATLFDPTTRELLRGALREMWQSELHLRQGDPRTALPYQYRALDLIKQVQQAGRIHLARVGLELPPIDPARRLSGDLSTLRPRRDPLQPATPRGELEARLWAALATPQPNAANDDLAALREALLDDGGEALAAIEPLDALRADPGCAACAAALRGVIWQRLATPPAGTKLRPPPGAGGRAYLDALEPRP
jgi:hypothetical protein